MMKTEIEVKFANVNHNELRKKLREAGAVCHEPMRTMKRVVIHTPEMSAKDAFIRIRDEGHRTTVTYKQFDKDSIDGAKEYEMVVDNFDEAVNIFTAGGLEYDVYQESRRENWQLGNVEIMLDEWPWLNPYVEIEGPSEEGVKHTAELLGFVWEEGVFGGVANLYRHQYPFIGEKGIGVINYEWTAIKFDLPAPDLLTQ